MEQIVSLYPLQGRLLHGRDSGRLTLIFIHFHSRHLAYPCCCAYMCVVSIGNLIKLTLTDSLRASRGPYDEQAEDKGKRWNGEREMTCTDQGYFSAK